jgi:hypothetical protein
MTKQKAGAELQARYYQLSRENKTLIIALAGELAAWKRSSSEREPERQEKKPSPAENDKK